jgi:hypothetical protein
MTQPELSAEADHDREAGGPPIEKRDQHLGSENPHRAPVKETNDPSHADIPGSDMDRGSEEVRARTRRDMH